MRLGALGQVRAEVAAVWLLAMIAAGGAWSAAPAWAILAVAGVTACAATFLALARARPRGGADGRSGEAWQREAERLAARAAQAEELRAVVESADEALLVTDARGVVVLCNQAAGAALGLAGDRAVGRPLVDAVTHEGFLRLHEAALAGAVRRGQVRLPGPTGVRVYDVTASPVWARGGERAAIGAGGADAGEPGTVRDAPSAGVVVTLRDMTELAAALQVKTDFVANASHELRTPIASIRAAAETLGDEHDDPAMRARLVRMIAEHAGRLQDLVDDMMDLSRLESPERDPVPTLVRMHEVAASLGKTFEAVCGARRVGLAFEVRPGAEAIWTDRELLMLILRNLIDNATKFADERSTVRVVATPIDGAGSAGARASEAAGVRLDVIDRGMGIPLNQQQRIFERFYQVDEARGAVAGRRGTGLGLAIVKHAVKRLGGSVRVHSVWKQGTTMTVELPSLRAGDSREPANADASPGAESGAGPRGA